MKTPCVIVAIGLCLGAGTTSHAVDSIKKTADTVYGDVKRVSKQEVELDRSGVSDKVPVNEIVMVYFADDPAQLKTARQDLLDGRYQDALNSLNEIATGAALGPLVKQDIDYYKAFCAAKLALGGSGAITEAGSQMATFAKRNPDSYHFFDANETVGDLLVAMGRYSSAERYYDRLAAAPWPDYRMRANVAIGRARLAQGKTAEARQAFQTVLGLTATTDLAKAQQLAARLGIASCEEDPDKAIQAVDDILATANREDMQLHARAYITKGNALRKVGRNQEALMAFLHVDLLYFAATDAHAEALFNLVELCNAQNKAERAVRFRRTLFEQYPNSSWTKRGGS